jgi:hypothetical protein
MLQVLNDSTRGGLVSQTAVSAPSVAAVDDPEDPTYRPALAAVDEIQRLVGVQHTLTVSFQVYCQTTTPSAHAKQYLEAAQVGLVKPSQMETFSLARVAPVRAEPIQDLSALGSGEMLSRANMDVTFAFVLNTADTALSYIELLTDTTLALEGGVSGTITETFDIDMT